MLRVFFFVGIDLSNLRRMACISKPVNSEQNIYFIFLKLLFFENKMGYPKKKEVLFCVVQHVRFFLGCPSRSRNRFTFQPLVVGHVSLLLVDMVLFNCCT